MKSWIIRSAAFFLGVHLALAIQPADATEQFHGLSYELPPQWTQEDQGDTRILRPRRLPSGETASITLRSPTRSASNDAAATLKKFLAVGNADLVSIELEGDLSTQVLNGGTLASQILVGEAHPWGRHYRWSVAYLGEGKSINVRIITVPATLSKSLMPAFTEFLTSLQFLPATAPVTISPPAPKPNMASGKLPIGDTPLLFPGMPGWLPSGRGVPVPRTEIANGKPQGVWWSNSGGSDVQTRVFFPDGTFFDRPRWGSGSLLDREGQQRISPDSLGQFAINDAQISIRRNGYNLKPSPYSIGSDANGIFFKVGGSFYRPLHPATPRDIVGRWKMASTQYEFGADGRFTFGQTSTTGDWMTSSKAGGSYFIDGWLLVLNFEGLHTTIESAGLANNNLLHLGTRQLIRQP